MNFFSIIGNSDATKLARVIERSLIALNYELPTSDENPDFIVLTVK